MTSNRSAATLSMGFIALLCGLALLGSSAQAHCQNKSGPAARPVDIKQVFDPSRIKEARYKLVMYNQDGNAVSDVTILDREIAVLKYENRPALRTTEILTKGNSRIKTIAYVDRGTLLPLYSEESTDEVVTQKTF